MTVEICGDLSVGDLIRWTYKYDEMYRAHMLVTKNKNKIYSYSEHCAVPISNNSILIYKDKTKYSWLCGNKIYSSFWVDDYFKAKL